MSRDWHLGVMSSSDSRRPGVVDTCHVGPWQHLRHSRASVWLWRCWSLHSCGGPRPNPCRGVGEGRTAVITTKSLQMSHTANTSATTNQDREQIPPGPMFLVLLHPLAFLLFWVEDGDGKGFGSPENNLNLDVPLTRPTPRSRFNLIQNNKKVRFFYLLASEWKCWRSLSVPGRVLSVLPGLRLTGALGTLWIPYS